MGQRYKLMWSGVARVRRSDFGTTFRFVTRYIDVLIVPWVLEPVAMYTYLLARLASLVIPLALTTLGAKAAPQLFRLARQETDTGFQAAAARVNLAYLMICGAVALCVLVSAPWIAAGLDLPQDAFAAILLWLVIGQSGPVLFGATGLLMRAVDRGTFHDVLMGLTALLFLAGIGTLGERGGVPVAQTLAAAQLTHAALCALLLTQSGVWPGLTALFHKEIKLF